MITTPQEYFSKLHLVVNNNPPLYALLPNAENVYNIDINTRVIDAPKFLGVRKDHKAETIYFIVDRYADYMDLSQTCCVITYINKLNQVRNYPVPFYDVYTYAKENKMLIPWCLDATVLAAAGAVQFTIQFFKVGERFNEETQTMDKVLTYSLNTLPATSIVKEGMEVSKFVDTQYLLEAGDFEALQFQIDNIARNQVLYWTILD